MSTGDGNAVLEVAQFLHKFLKKFMYYSFTIAMCYQTSDVTVTGPWMRRVTLMHAIVSFAFVLIILGYTVNAIGTAV